LLAWHGRALLRDGRLDTVREAALCPASRGVSSRVVDDLLGEACRLGGDYAPAIKHFQKALTAAGRGTVDLRGSARASTLQGLAYSLLKTGEMEHAADIAREALK